MLGCIEGTLVKCTTCENKEMREEEKGERGTGKKHGQCTAPGLSKAAQGWIAERPFGTEKCSGAHVVGCGEPEGAAYSLQSP